MLCLDDLSIVELEGQYKHDDGGFLKLSIIKCDDVTDDGKQCASKEDQEKWRKHTGVLLFYNRQKFRSAKYDGSHIHNQLEDEKIKLKYQRYIFTVKKHEL